MSNDLAPAMTSSGAMVVIESGGSDAAGFETLDSTQTLEPGYYWTAQEDVRSPSGRVDVNKDDTLLLLEVHEFEDKPHSVVLNCHPRDGEGTITMLVEEFLGAFVPCRDAESIRAREQQEVMNRVAELQHELMAVQSDQRLMIEAVKPEVEKALEELERAEQREAESEVDVQRKRDQNLAKVHRRAARRSEAKGNPLTVPKIALASEIGNLIDAGINDQGVNEMKRFASRQAVVAQAQANWLTTKTGQISATLKSLTPYVKERAAVAIARASGAVQLAKRIRRGIESLDLYTGKGVEVFEIKSGAEAPPEEKLSLIQSKRYAEEELAAWADTDDMFDARDKKEFFEALAANDSLLNQVLPTPRCVASVAMTRWQRNYGDNAYENMVRNLENQLVFLLVRNGENVHVVYSSSPSHEGARRLFPTRDELEQPFRGYDGSTVSLRDVAFVDAKREFDDIALCYKRFLILLCGLDHRLGLFGRFYPPQEQMQFMTVGFQERHFNFVADEEPELLLGDAMPPLSDWLRSKNVLAQSGSRIFVFPNASLLAHAPELSRRRNLEADRSRLGRPLIAHREGNRLFVTLATVSNWNASEPDVKCYLGDAADVAKEAWWLCVDAVNVEEVKRFRHSRVSRSMGVGYLRLFRRVQAYLEAEAAVEAPARSYLLHTAVEHGGLSDSAARAAVDTAVRNWRASRRGAPLPSVDDKAALNPILSLMVPEGQLPGDLEAMLKAYIADAAVVPLLVTRTGKNKLLLYVAPTAEDKSAFPAVVDWHWTRRITLEAGKTKLKATGSSLVWLGKVLPASEVEVARYDGLDAWLNTDKEPISLRDYGQAKQNLADANEWKPVLLGGPGSGFPDEMFGRIFGRIRDIHQAERDADDAYYRRTFKRRARSVPSLCIAIPLAIYATGGKPSMAYMYARAEAALYCYGNAEQRAAVQTFYTSQFVKRDAGAKHLHSFAWHLAHNAAGVKLRHDQPFKGEGSHYSADAEWKTLDVKVNEKRRKGKRQEPGPKLDRARAHLSLDRAFDALTGRVTTLQERAFYRKLRSDMSWGWRSAEERKALAQKRYVHAYRAELSPLILSEKTPGRVMANKLFTAPFRKRPQSKE